MIITGTSILVKACPSEESLRPRSVVKSNYTTQSSQTNQQPPKHHENITRDH